MFDAWIGLVHEGPRGVRLWALIRHRGSRGASRASSRGALGDHPLLEQLNDAEMTKDVGGPESPEQLAERQSRYEEPGSRQYRIVDGSSGEAVGWVGYWDHTWREEQVWETGWAVLPASQGRGIASAATSQLLERARAQEHRRYVHAYPKVENAPSNAICRKLGFELLGEVDFPVRREGVVRCNDWRFDLFADGG